MKRIIALITAVFLTLCLCACGEPKTGDTESESKNAVFKENNVVVSKAVFPKNTTLSVEVLTDTAKFSKALPHAQSVVAYDITAVLDNKSVQPQEAVEVSFPLPPAYDALKHSIEVYYIADDLTTERVDSAVVDGKVVARLNHFSVYAVTVAEKTRFKLAVDANAVSQNGQKVFVSDKNLTFEFSKDDTWTSFAQRNAAKGFSVDKDFYGKEDVVYYTENGVKYHIAKAVNLGKVTPNDKIEKNTDYACCIPHRETIQTQWFYDVSVKEFYVAGYSDPFHKSGKELSLDTKEMTYTIKSLRYQKLSGESYILLDEVLETGTYTSNDGDTLGATLTLSNGYVLETTRSNSFVAQLKTGDKTITAKTDVQVNFFDVTG